MGKLCGKQTKVAKKKRTTKHSHQKLLALGLVRSKNDCWCVCGCCKTYRSTRHPERTPLSPFFLACPLEPPVQIRNEQWRPDIRNLNWQPLLGCLGRRRLSAHQLSSPLIDPGEGLFHHPRPPVCKYRTVALQRVCFFWLALSFSSPFRAEAKTRHSGDGLAPGPSCTHQGGGVAVAPSKCRKVSSPCSTIVQASAPGPSEARKSQESFRSEPLVPSARVVVRGTGPGC